MEAGQSQGATSISCSSRVWKAEPPTTSAWRSSITARERGIVSSQVCPSTAYRVSLEITADAAQCDKQLGREREQRERETLQFRKAAVEGWKRKKLRAPLVPPVAPAPSSQPASQPARPFAVSRPERERLFLSTSCNYGTIKHSGVDSQFITSPLVPSLSPSSHTADQSEEITAFHC